MIRTSRPTPKHRNSERLILQPKKTLRTVPTLRCILLIIASERRSCQSASGTPSAAILAYSLLLVPLRHGVAAVSSSARISSAFVMFFPSNSSNGTKFSDKVFEFGQQDQIVAAGFWRRDLGSATANSHYRI